MSSKANNEKNPKRPSFMRILKSVVAAAVGVQSQRNHDYDSQQTSLWHYVIAGVILTLVFVVSLVGLVLLVVRIAG